MLTGNTSIKIKNLFPIAGYCPLGLESGAPKISVLSRSSQTSQLQVQFQLIFRTYQH